MTFGGEFKRMEITPYPCIFDGYCESFNESAIQDQRTRNSLL
jgi:hypothetical protein